MEHSKAVVFVISHSVRPGHESSYEEWIREILGAVSHAPGYRGREVIRPVPGKRTYTTIIRFDAQEHLDAWIQSDARKSFIQRASPMLEKGDHYEIKTGIEFWFTPESVRPPKRWKQFILTLSAVYPLTVIIPLLFGPVFAAAPVFVEQYFKGLVVAATLTALLTFVVMPHYTKLVRRWLFEE